MYRLMLLFATCSLYGSEILVSYLDKVQYEQNNIYVKNFPVNIEKRDIDSGMSIAFSYPLSSESSVISIRACSSFSKWDLASDVTYAYTTSFAARVSPMSFFIVSPYIEFSAAGPTYLSKDTLNDISFGSKIVYQNYVSAGIKVANFVLDFKLINYSTDLQTAFSKNSVTLPFLLSAGCSY